MLMLGTGTYCENVRIIIFFMEPVVQLILYGVGQRMVPPTEEQARSQQVRKPDKSHN